MKKTGIFYGSSTGKTEDVAKRIAARAGIADKDIHNVAETKPSEIAEYDILLLGSSTWGSKRPEPVSAEHSNRPIIPSTNRKLS